MDECGGGGSMITFKIPAEARMFLIPPLYIKYCQNQGIDPSDRVACDHYREVIDGSEEMLAGLYTYVAIWSDGYTRTGQFELERNSRGIQSTKVALRFAPLWRSIGRIDNFG